MTVRQWPVTGPSPVGCYGDLMIPVSYAVVTGQSEMTSHIVFGTENHVLWIE